MSGIFSSIVSSMSNMVRSQLSGFTKIATRITNFGNSTLQYIQVKTASVIKLLTSKPKSKKDYWSFGGIYLAKRLVTMSAILVGAILVIFYSMIFPRANGYLWYAKFVVSSDALQQFTGNKVKIYDTNNQLIYKGAVSSGKPKGFGIQYDLNGRLKYKGNFELGKYSGSGELFDSSGKLQYSGNFEDNKYNGSGQLLSGNGKIIYSGEFSKGEKSGKGIEYDPNSGNVKYYGEFINGKYAGKGILYASGSDLPIYEGDFSNGLFEGVGKKYSDGHLIYTGSFKNGKYSGDGTLYNKSSGHIIYVGQFDEDLYSGTGKLYDKNNFNLSYEGSFANGKKDGTGTLYDKLGILVFNGDFKNDGIDFVKHFGKSISNIREQFGNETKKLYSDDKIMLFYAPIDCVIIFEKEDDSYNFKRVIIGKEFDFMGLRDATESERKIILGSPFSSTKLEINNFQRDAFSILKLSDLYDNVIYSEKYIFENYFVRIFFSSDNHTASSIEVGKC